MGPCSCNTAKALFKLFQDWLQPYTSAYNPGRSDPGLPFPPFSQAIRPLLTTTISVLPQGSPENASETPLSTLASYVTFNFAESNGRTAALEAVNVMAVVAARSAPGLPLARILKIDSGESYSGKFL